MSLKIGIIGLPNVGKSTLFNAILGRQMALAAPYPFATVEPNVGVAEVPDERLEKLRDGLFPIQKTKNFGTLGKLGEPESQKIRESENQKISDPVVRSSDGLKLRRSEFSEFSEQPPLVFATVTFVDIAGLVKGAAKGQGLGNQFLSHIRDVDLILHVLRDFDAGIPRAPDSKNPEHDAEIVRTELELKDLEIIEREKGSLGMTTLSSKPVIYAVNVGEDKLQQFSEHSENSENRISPEIQRVGESEFPAVRFSDFPTFRRSESSEFSGRKKFIFCAKVEEDISKMPKNEQKEYLKIYGLERSCLDRIISECFHALGLISFFTAGPKEVRAWPLRRGSPAPKAAAVIHSDFEKLFIRAEVINWQKLARAGSWQTAKEKGWVRTEGKDYLVKDGDVCNFLIGKQLS